MPSAAPRAVRLRPPAKLNLFLELLRRRPDGFHELDTVMVPIDWCDRLRVARRAEPGIELHARWLPASATVARRLGTTPGSAESESLVGLPAPEENLVHRALHGFVTQYGVSGGFEAELCKQIPAGAGMGGASSDAASALQAAARLCGVSLADPGLTALASQLGSDVPFFLGAGGRPLQAARARGRGERIEPVRLGAPLSVVVVYPNQPLSTARVYRACHVLNQPQSAEPLVEALQQGCLRSIGASTLNRLAAPALELAPPVEEILQFLWKSGLIGCQLTGSGSACFGLARSARQARQAAAMLRGQLEPGAVVRAVQSASVPPPVELEWSGRDQEVTRQGPEQ